MAPRQMKLSEKTIENVETEPVEHLSQRKRPEEARSGLISPPSRPPDKRLIPNRGNRQVGWTYDQEGLLAASRNRVRQRRICDLHYSRYRSLQVISRVFLVVPNDFDGKLPGHASRKAAREAQIFFKTTNVRDLVVRSAVRRWRDIRR
jgi:hypothetical protein